MRMLPYHGAGFAQLRQDADLIPVLVIVEDRREGIFACDYVLCGKSGQRQGTDVRFAAVAGTYVVLS